MVGGGAIVAAQTLAEKLSGKFALLQCRDKTTVVT
jgi:hypothetical protein